MGFKCGIVGLPNVGKSTLFNALTNAGAAAANFPFCTIEPNVGIVSVPDLRLNALAKIVSPQKVIPTTVKFMDIAGLVRGAAKEGAGLGNRFLANIRETEAIVQVVRCFIDSNVTHVSGQVDPVDDVETIHTELVLADHETIEKARKKNAKFAKRANKEVIKEQEFLVRLENHLNEGNRAAIFPLQNDDERQWLAARFLLTAKPMLLIANVTDLSEENGPLVQKLKYYAEKHHFPVIVLSAALEAELSQLDEADKPEFLAGLNLGEPGLNRLIRAGYGLLNLQTYFTAGEKEVRAWTLPIGARAPEAAGVIHSDFEKGFIRAEVIAYQDYIDYNGELGARDAGKLRIEGKDYVVHDGDVMHFRFNV